MRAPVHLLSLSIDRPERGVSTCPATGRAISAARPSSKPCSPIIGVGLLALSSAIPLVAYGMREGNQLSTVTFLANQRLEQVRNAPGRVGPRPSTASASRRPPPAAPAGRARAGR